MAAVKVATFDCYGTLIDWEGGLGALPPRSAAYGATVGRTIPDGHRTAELRSIALHGLVADRLDEELLELARSRVERWIADDGPVPAFWATRWRDLLRQPLPTIARLLVEDSEDMRDLRQNTPFAGVIEPRERWQILDVIR